MCSLPFLYLIPLSLTQKPVPFMHSFNTLLMPTVDTVFLLLYVESYLDLVWMMWNHGEPIRSVFLYPALARYVKNNQPDKLHRVMELLRDTGLGADAMV